MVQVIMQTRQQQLESYKPQHFRGDAYGEAKVRRC